MKGSHNRADDPGATAGITPAVYVCPNGLSEGAGPADDLENHWHGLENGFGQLIPGQPSCLRHDFLRQDALLLLGQGRLD